MNYRVSEYLGNYFVVDVDVTKPICFCTNESAAKTICTALNIGTGTTYNNRYASTLSVIHEFDNSKRMCRLPYGFGVFKSWIEKRLNAEDGTSHS